MVLPPSVEAETPHLVQYSQHCCFSSIRLFHHFVKVHTQTTLTSTSTSHLQHTNEPHFVALIWFCLPQRPPHVPAAKRFTVTSAFELIPFFNPYNKELIGK